MKGHTVPNNYRLSDKKITAIQDDYLKNGTRGTWQDFAQRHGVTVTSARRWALRVEETKTKKKIPGTLDKWLLSQALAALPGIVARRQRERLEWSRKFAACRLRIIEANGGPR